MDCHAAKFNCLARNDKHIVKSPKFLGVNSALFDKKDELKR